MSGDALAQQASCLRELAKATYAAADDELGSGGWSRLVFDYRVDPVETGQAVEQFRALTPQGSVSVSSVGLGDIPWRLHSLRESLPGEPWYGLCLIIRSDGKVHVKYDYDRNCLEGILDDTRFYEDLL